MARKLSILKKNLISLKKKKAMFSKLDKVFCMKSKIFYY